MLMMGSGDEEKRQVRLTWMRVRWRWMRKALCRTQKSRGSIGADPQLWHISAVLHSQYMNPTLAVTSSPVYQTSSLLFASCVSHSLSLLLLSHCSPAVRRKDAMIADLAAQVKERDERVGVLEGLIRQQQDDMMAVVNSNE